jgi:RHS repeat-associated protein
MMWLSRAGIYAPTFRAYAQHFGRFNQTDPLVYAGDGPNVYAYVLDDPVNFIDPFGWEYRALNPPCGPAGCTFDPITGNIFVTGAALDFGAPLSGAGGSGGGTFGRPFSPIAGFNLNPSSGGGSNSSGGNRPAATETPLCAPASSAVYVLEFFGTAADIAALGSAGAAALTSPLPPVAIGFGIFAGTMKAISLGAGLGVTAIHAYNGNWVSAGTSFASTTIGALGGRGIQALGRIEGKKIGDLTASAAETGLAHAVSAGGC